MIWLYISLFVVSCLVLIRSGTWTVRSLTRISQFLGWREFVVASILMAFATSLPELFVGIIAAFNHQPDLVFGNVVGSNIIALTLVIGIGAILAKGLKFEGAILQKSSLYAVIIGLLPLLLLFDGKLSRIDGVILLGFLVFYFNRLFTQEEKFSKIYTDSFKREWTNFKLFLKDVGVFALAIILLLLSAQGIVFSAEQIAVTFSIPLVIIGLFLVAFGTSVPELVFGVKSVVMGHNDMVIGGAVGSVVVNSTLILGLAVLIYPFRVFNFSPYLAGIIFTVIAAVFFYLFARTDQEITRKEAFFLLEIYVLFVLVEIIVHQCYNMPL